MAFTPESGMLEQVSYFVGCINNDGQAQLSHRSHNKVIKDD